MSRKTLTHFATQQDSATSEIGAGLAFLSKKKIRARKNG